MIAYHNNPQVKTNILLQLKEHHDQDEIIQGVTWEHGKGCAVGCTLHAYSHALYEERFGIPQMLAYLEDTIFEGLPNADAKGWPMRFMSAVKVGSDLSRVGWQFQHWLLTDEKVNPGINHPLVKDAVKGVADLIFKLAAGESIMESAESVESVESVESAARSVESVESAARSVESVESAESAPWSAAQHVAYQLMADKLIALLEATR